MFDESQIIKLLQQGVDIYKDIDDLTLEMSKLVLKNRYTKDLKYFKYWDDELINLIIADKNIISNFDVIPNFSLDQIIKEILVNPIRLKCFMYIIFDQNIYNKSYDQEYGCIEYIPYNFQTNYMHIDIRTKHLELVRFLRDRNQADFDKLISRYSGYIQYIPEEFQTLSKCKKCVEYNELLLKYCYCIDREMLKSIFKSEQNKKIPKKDRFNFICYFNEDALIRILKVKFDLLRILSQDQQTDKLVSEVLESDGYALQHIVNPTKKHIEIALLQQPKAIKYVK